MNEWFIFAASCVCLSVGIALCFLPASKYAKTSSVGVAGALILVCGIVLMTTFKWTEVAFKISEVEVRIAEALKERDDARALAASSQSSLKAVASAADPASQDKALDEIVGSVYFLEANDAERVKVYTSLKNAIQDRNFTVVPTSVLPSNLDPLAPTDAGPAPSPTFQ